jgi:hypothetical protein
MRAMSTTSPLTLLPIDECEEWIWDILDSTRDCGFEYIADQHKDFLIFNTNDFHADTRALYKIRKITGMRLIQMSTHNGNSQLWFFRSRHPSVHQHDDT